MTGSLVAVLAFEYVVSLNVSALTGFSAARPGKLRQRRQEGHRPVLIANPLDILTPVPCWTRSALSNMTCVGQKCFVFLPEQRCYARCLAAEMLG